MPLAKDGPIRTYFSKIKSLNKGGFNSKRIFCQAHFPQRNSHSSLIGAVKCCCIRAIFGKGYIKSKPYFLDARIQDPLSGSRDLIFCKLTIGLKGADGQKKCQDVFWYSFHDLSIVFISTNKGMLFRFLRHKIIFVINETSST